MEDHYKLMSKFQNLVPSSKDTWWLMLFKDIISLSSEKTIVNFKFGYLLTQRIHELFHQGRNWVEDEVVQSVAHNSKNKNWWIITSAPLNTASSMVL
jgi:hypothetical protein